MFFLFLMHRMSNCLCFTFSCCVNVSSLASLSSSLLWLCPWSYVAAMIFPASNLHQCCQATSVNVDRCHLRKVVITNGRSGPHGMIPTFKTWQRITQNTAACSSTGTTSRMPVLHWIPRSTNPLRWRLTKRLSSMEPQKSFWRTWSTSRGPSA